MWPWGHLAVGYLTFSAVERLSGRRPTDGAAIVLAVATQLPDLVDKPLAWQFHLLDSGIGAAHSLLVGVPLALVAALALRLGDHRGPAVGLVVGYVTHVLGDLLFAGLFGSSSFLEAFLWPLYARPRPRSPGLVPTVLRLLENSIALAGTARGRGYFVGVMVLLALTVVVWVWDGTPGVRWLRHRGR